MIEKICTAVLCSSIRLKYWDTLFSDNRILSDSNVKDPSVVSSHRFLWDFVEWLDPIRSDRIYSPGLLLDIFRLILS